jgi:hypothetical protein
VVYITFVDGVYKDKAGNTKKILIKGQYVLKYLKSNIKKESRYPVLDAAYKPAFDKPLRDELAKINPDISIWADNKGRGADVPRKVVVNKDGSVSVEKPFTAGTTDLSKKAELLEALFLSLIGYLYHSDGTLFNKDDITRIITYIIQNNEVANIHHLLDVECRGHRNSYLQDGYDYFPKKEVIKQKRVKGKVKDITKEHETYPLSSLIILPLARELKKDGINKKDFLDEFGKSINSKITDALEDSSQNFDRGLVGQHSVDNYSPIHIVQLGAKVYQIIYRIWSNVMSSELSLPKKRTADFTLIWGDLPISISTDTDAKMTIFCQRSKHTLENLKKAVYLGKNENHAIKPYIISYFQHYAEIPLYADKDEDGKTPYSVLGLSKYDFMKIKPLQKR